MTQLTLELTGYPRPIAWTLSELERTVGDRDLRDMLLTAFEDVTRYLTLMTIARYAEYFAQGRNDEDVENVLQGLRRPSFGHYVQALRALDQFLVQNNDPFFALGLSRSDAHPAAMKLCEATATAKAKKVSFVTMLSRVVEIRNREKGHGYTGQHQAREATDLLVPALREFLEHLPILISQPLVWIERIEVLGPDDLKVTFLELMGTNRAARRTRDIRQLGGLRPRFIYMWNGESPPLQLTPFFHLEEAGNDEVVYVLAGLGSDPMYKAPGIIEPRRPDPLMAQLTERAPFLLKPEASITVSRAPDAERRYRDLVDMALADGLVTAGEASRLATHRAELGLSEAEAEKIHEALGWSGLPSAPPAAASIPVVVPEPVPDRVGISVARDAPREGIEYAATMPAVITAAEASRGAWPDAGRTLVAAVRDALAGALSFDPELVLMDEEIDVGQGELWIELQPSRGVSLWFPDSRKQLRDGQVQLAVGFYSQNQRRDPAYRAARSRLEAGEPPVVPAGWSALTSERTLLGSPLAFETSRRFPIAALAEREAVDEVTRVVVSLAERAHAVLGDAEDDDGEADADARARAPLTIKDPPVVREVPGDFMLSPLDGDPRIHGSVWIARILWALEWAARHGAEPRSAADIARILSDNGVRVPPTNTARAFRTPRDDPRRTGLCEEIGEQRYVISASGRRALFELLTGG